MRKIEEKEREKAKAEIEKHKRMTEEELSRLQTEQKMGAADRKKLEERLERERREREQALKQREIAEQRLKTMEEKLLVGAKHLDKAAKQEHELRKATIELEERRRQELELARELEKREEDQILVEEQFESLQDEVDAKSRKLKKVSHGVLRLLQHGRCSDSGRSDSGRCSRCVLYSITDHSSLCFFLPPFLLAYASA